MSCFQFVDIESVAIPDRRRRQVKGIEALATAIREAGRLINPVTVTEGMVLAAGYRRLMACKSLGWKEIPVHVIHGEQLDAAIVEIAENLHREELTALERAEHTAEWKGAFLAKHPEAGHGKTPGNKGKGKGKAAIKECKLHSLIGEMQKATGKDASTARRDAQIAESIPKEVRDAVRETPIADNQSELLKLSRLPEDHQKDVVEIIASGRGKNVRHAVKLLAGEKIAAEPKPLPDGPFRTIVIDPPWQYDKRPADASTKGAIEYPTMTPDQIAALPVARMATADCVLWLWTTNAHMFDALTILGRWGFAQKTILTWIKDRPGLGEWLLGQTEHCLLATRGSPIVLLTNQSTALHAKRREHSRKPEEFYAMVDSLCPGSKCELFARTPRPGWTQHGNEIDRFESKESA